MGDLLKVIQMQPLKKWINDTVKPFLKQSTEREDYHTFMRDELRPIIRDDSNMYSCADGVVLYNKIVNSPKEKVDIKGNPYSIEDILGEKSLIEGPALVCGIFMTFADIHLNRAPYDSILSFKMLDPIESFNLSMDDMENKLFDGLRGRKFPSTSKTLYTKNNARMQNRFYIPKYNYNYYVVQIADYQVDVIQHFTTKQKQVFMQGERFSFIRWGSQCDLIMPLRKDLNIKPLIPPMIHVEAGVDKVAQLV